MEFSTYQEGTNETNVYAESIQELLEPIYDYLWFGEEKNEALARLVRVEELLNLAYVVLGLTGEAGEVANKAKKVLRGDVDLDEARDGLAKEVGGVFWYGVGQLPRELGVTPEEIAQDNLDILRDRQERGVIKGSGDER